MMHLIVLLSGSLLAQTPVSFRNQVIPVLTKMGCNQGACHGALAGKNGFKLTLRGYDPDADYDTLTRQAVGRRVSLADPAASLILQKATFGIPHGGGKKFSKDSLEYKILFDWIAGGAPPPLAGDPDVVSLEVTPASAVLQPGAEQQLAVRAKYSNGKIEDVTRWVKYNSNSDAVASVDEAGKVKMNGNGEVAITLYYQSRVLYSRLTVPFANLVHNTKFADSPGTSPVFKPQAVIEVAIYIGTRTDAPGDGVYYLDDIVAVHDSAIK